MQDYEYFLSSIKNIKGIGKKTAQLFLKKKIIIIFDLLWHMPTSKIQTSLKLILARLTALRKLLIFLERISYLSLRCGGPKEPSSLPPQ